MNKQEISVLSAFIITFVFSVLSGQIYEAQQIKNNTLRLHIIANSNSVMDQQDKLLIRDELMAMEDVLPVYADSFSGAVAQVQDNIDVIEQRINDILEKSNKNYTARCSLENFCFDTTQYDSFALPKGEYTALTVRLGKADGNNWWCVMYPALCSQSFCDTAYENSTDFIKTEKLIPRFKVVEIYEDVKNFFVKTDTEIYKNIG